MKILKAGTKNMATWWHGKSVTCVRCQQVVELEAGDEALWSVNMTGGSVTLECSCCGQRTMIFDPAKPVVERKMTPDDERMINAMAWAQAEWMAGVPSGEKVRHFQNG